MAVPVSHGPDPGAEAPRRSLPDEQLPDLVSRIHSLGINGRYHLDVQTAINFGYRFETLSTDDFALDGVGVDTIDQVLSLGESSPDYVAHVFQVSLSYRF